MNLENLDIVAEYEEYLEGSDKSLWGEPYPCWIKFNNETKELSIKFEYIQDNDKPNTYVTFSGKQSPNKPLLFYLMSNKPDVDNATMQVKADYEDGFWYFEGFSDVSYVENIAGLPVQKVERRIIDIYQVESND